jgi:indole-3-glycerol phosphate synthase
VNKRDFLENILKRRRERVQRDRAICDRQLLRRDAALARQAKPPHRLRDALLNGDGVKIIGEFKRASPSRGLIRVDANLEQTIALYEMAGVCAVSVLTEPDFFRGALEDLQQARVVTALPILRKDFIVDEYQIEEAAAAGADAVLLIVTALADADLLRLRKFAEDELGLDALVEVHASEEIERAAQCGAKLIGVNNRDLRTFATSLETSMQLAPLAPPGTTLVSESGISSAADVERLIACGYKGFLIGESLMEAENPAKLIRQLCGAESRHHA